MKISKLILTFFLALIPIQNMLAQPSILNVSYDPTREFYAEYNQLFLEHWSKNHTDTPTIKQSHGGSGKQARSVIDGLEADVVTLALAYDIDEIANRSQLLPTNWQKELEHNSSPYTSTIVFLVRKDNPKQIKDWDDLIKPGIEVITPNPKTSGGARWNYLAAYAYFLKKNSNDANLAKSQIAKLFKNVPVLDTGARAATTTFAQRQLGDVLITWENEAYLAQKEFASDELLIITPSLSILAEPPVAVVTKNAEKHKTLELSKEYLKFLYSDDAQRLAAKHYFRPSNPNIFKEFENKFSKVELVTIGEIFTNWANAQKIHFDEGGIFDQIYGQE